MVKTSPYQDGTDYTEVSNASPEAIAAAEAAEAAQVAAETAEANTAMIQADVTPKYNQTVALYALLSHSSLGGI